MICKTVHNLQFDYEEMIVEKTWRRGIIANLSGGRIAHWDGSTCLQKPQLKVLVPTPKLHFI